MSLSVGGVEKALRDPALALGAQMAVESSQRTNKAQDINACLSLTPCQRFLNANTHSGGTLESHRPGVHSVRRFSGNSGFFQ